jgi:hypothetical protein
MLSDIWRKHAHSIVHGGIALGFLGWAGGGVYAMHETSSTPKSAEVSAGTELAEFGLMTAGVFAPLVGATFTLASWSRLSDEKAKDRMWSELTTLAGDDMGLVYRAIAATPGTGKGERTLDGVKETIKKMRNDGNAQPSGQTEVNYSAPAL